MSPEVTVTGKTVPSVDEDGVKPILVHCSCEVKMYSPTATSFNSPRLSPSCAGGSKPRMLHMFSPLSYALACLTV